VAAAVPFAVQAGLSAVSAWLFRTLPEPDAQPTRQRVSARGLLREMREGAGWLLRRRRLRLITLLSGSFAFADTAWFAIFALYVRQTLGLPVSAYGLLVGVAAVGGLGGGLSAARLSTRVATGPLLAGLLIAAAARRWGWRSPPSRS
jgi:predicted MFS family arabinose efflux permease